MSNLITLIQDSPFLEISAILALAAFVGTIGATLKQPIVVSFIAVGVLTGPSGLHIVKSSQNVDLLAELGVAVLLFLVGLKLDLKLIKTLGKVSVATGLGQVLFTSVIGFLIGLALSLDWITSAYVAVALTFSSTIIIVKLLSDKKEADSLHGRIAIGFLIVQDLAVVFAMMILSALGLESLSSGVENGWLQVVLLFSYVLLMVGFVILFAKYMANPILFWVSKFPELLITFAIAWAVVFAAIGGAFGLSKELGGLLAGVSLASTPYREAIVSRLSSLREFLLLFFFVALGSHLDLSSLSSQVGPALIFSLFVLIGNPLIVLIILGYLGYKKRTGLLAGLTVAQISEFSLIFMAMGVSLGHVNREALSLVTLVGLVTIAASVYMITYSHVIYRLTEPLLGWFQRKTPWAEAEQNQTQLKQIFDVILFGLGRYGSAIAKQLKEKDVSFLVLDFNPSEVKAWKKLGYNAIYADACDVTILNELPVHMAKWVIVALPQHDLGLTHEDPRLVLLNGLKSGSFRGKVAVSTYHCEEVDTLREKGADIVLLPFQDSADKISHQVATTI